MSLTSRPHLLPFLALTAVLSLHAFAQPADAPAHDASGPDAPTTHPLALCSAALTRAWDAVDRADAAAVTEALDTVAATRGCDVLTTEAADHYLQGRLALLAANPEEAVRRFDRALDADSVRRGDRPRPAEIRYYAGLAREAAGDLPGALQQYSRLAADYPADARVALILPVLEEPPATTPQDRLAGALHAVDNHNYSAAGRILTRLIAERLGRPVAVDDPAFVEALAAALAEGDDLLGEATYQLGYLWYYWIRALNPQAIPLLGAVAESRHERRADAAYFLARSYMRAEDYDSARAAWERFRERHGRDERAHEATYYLGWLYMDREQFAEAIPGFEEYLDRHGRGGRHELARWYLGWSHFRLGHWTEAREQFQRMDGGYLYGAKGRYWEGRCLREEGREDDAREAFQDVIDEHDLTYYALLARQQLGLPLVEPRDHRLLPSPTQRVAELAPGQRTLEGLQALLEAGDALHVMRYYEDTRPDRGLRGADMFLVRQAGGDAHDDFNAARGHGGTTRSRPPGDDDAFLHWLQRYPRPFDRWIEPAAAELGIDPLWIWSHVQIESHYHTGYISYADAQGLLQIIPRTGMNIAAALGEPYAEGMLMNPQLNIRYAAWYLAALLREFGGQLPLAIAAYNSGAGSMARWVEENHELPFDAFVEEIPYDQSREYVKKVIGMYAHYLVLYASDEALAETLARLLPAEIEPTVLGEITY